MSALIPIAPRFRFNARGRDGLLDGKLPSQPSKLNNA